jgi:hypothetical protein
MVEADVTARGDIGHRTHLAFFTVLVIRDLPEPPTRVLAESVVSEYLHEAHVPLEFDFVLIEVEELEAPA